jgi:flagellar biosynthesis protein FlhG
MKTIAVTGGKGGSGKTVIAANLGIALAKEGQRVTLFDADLGLANLDIMMGLRAEHTLQDVLSGDKTLAEIMIQGPGGVQVIPGGSGVRSLLSVGPKKLNVFLSQVPELAADTDILMFDTGAGIDAKVTSFVRAADVAVVVTTPDPACIVDAYATLKTLFRHKPDACVQIVVNMVRNDIEAMTVFVKLQEIVNGFLDKHIQYAGYVRLDGAVQNYVRKRTPFVVGDPSLPASNDVQKLARGLVGVLGKMPDGVPSLQLQEAIANTKKAA